MGYRKDLRHRTIAVLGAAQLFRQDCLKDSETLPTEQEDLPAASVWTLASTETGQSPFMTVLDFPTTITLTIELGMDGISAGQLAADLDDRGDQLFRRAGRSGHVGRGLVRAAHRAGGPHQRVAGGMRQRDGDRLQRRGAVADGAQHRRDALAEVADLLLDRDAAAFLLAERRALALGLDAVGDVVVRADPVFAAADRAKACMRASVTSISSRAWPRVIL